MFVWDPASDDFGVTPVENAFIADYLPFADGNHVKVYLYCLYLTGRQLPIHSAEDIRDALRLDDTYTVEKALRFWERRGLLKRISDNPPEYAVRSPMWRRLSGEEQTFQDSGYAQFYESVCALFGDKRKVKPAEISVAYDWVEDFHLSPEAVLMLLSYCRDNLKVSFSFSRAQQMALDMKEAGVQTPGTWRAS